MSSATNYLFCSARLGFRNWEERDIKPMSAINADKDVMEFFPDIQDETVTANALQRMNQLYAQKGYCFFAVDLLETGDLIGFIGFNDQVNEADFTPCVEIGWRLKKEVWNKGLASEGALTCLDYAFTQLGLTKIYAITPKINLRSERIMQKAGLRKEKNFHFVLLKDSPHLEECVLYSIQRPT